MRIHHLNCVSACPIGGRLLDGVGRLTSHCLLLESERTLTLVDTGYGIRDVRAPRTRLARSALALLRPELREEMTAVRQIEQLGFRPRDVRHIVLSHLDFDHAGGLDDFPEARVHLLAAEVMAARARRTRRDRMRYRSQQWGSRARWQPYDPELGEAWFGFEHVRAPAGLGGEVLLVPLVGHTLGHAGVAVRRAAGWLFYAADAYFYHGEMDVARPHCTPGLALFQTLMEANRSARLANQARLRELKRAHGAAVEIFCAHDVQEFERISGRSHRDPIEALPRSRVNGWQRRGAFWPYS